MLYSKSTVLAFLGMAVSSVFAQAGSTPTSIIPTTVTFGQAPVTPTGMRAEAYSGCYNSSEPMVFRSEYNFQSKGNCKEICYYLGQYVMGMTNGDDCWCGMELPPVSSKVDDSMCTTKCLGFPGDTCGGAGLWTVFLTGVSINSVSAFSSSTSSTSTTAITTATQTVSSSPVPKKSSNTVGIVVGVIVAIVVISGLAGVAFFYFRRRQQQEMEEFRKQSDLTGFMGGGKVDPNRPQMWAPDQRLDTAATSNRLSSGTIADNQDYSRRILQVRNPDGF